MTVPLPRLRVVPLGGLGEIGMNCMALEVGDEILVVDCGVTFPRSNLGIDIYHPDFTWLESRRDKIKGLVITHGHEDHIGAIPFFCERFDVPIWGPRYSIELIKLRLAEHGYDDGEVDLRSVQPRQRLQVGGFEVEPIRVTHSISDATALCIRTKAGTVIHTGDFKLDPSPGDGEQVTDEERLAEMGHEGVRLLLSDSTNVDSHGKTQSEAVAARVLREVTESCTGRVIIGMFASNMPRLKALGEVAMATGRRLLLLGRSVQTHVRIATELGRLKWPSDLLVNATDANSIPRRQLLAVASGTQAERQAALWRLSLRQHPLLTLDAGDRVVMSSRIIPGNDPNVVEMLGNFVRLGIEVRNPLSDPGVHVSGHAYRDEQLRMIDLVRPTSFVPVHGTVMHLHRHAELARERGVDEVVVLENGEIGEFTDESALRKTLENVPWGKVATWDGEPIPDRVLSDREAIARSGIAFVTVLVSGRGRPVGPATVATRGVLDEQSRGAVLKDAAREVVKALQDHAWPQERPSDEAVADLVRQVARRQIERAVGKRPVTVAQVVRVKG